MKRTVNPSVRKKPPKVRIARPKGRPFQLRYRCPKLRKEVRVSLGSRDESIAKQMKAELEARLILGIEMELKKPKPRGPEMEWTEFRELYRVLHLQSLRKNTAVHAESRLDIAEAILKPKSLGQVASPTSLQTLQTRLLGGAHSKRKKPRSIHTTRGYMNSILSALNWAYLQGWLPTQPRVRKFKAAKAKMMKGRPITQAEFNLMLKATDDVVDKENVDSWKHVLNGLWTSALRLNELMNLSWDIPGTIRPVWRAGQLPVLEIPAELQKNDTDQTIPLIPWFEELLLTTPLADRHGWVFQPKFLSKYERPNTVGDRPTAEWVGRIISRIGKKADIVVEPENKKTGRPTKYVSAHDLRRSCGQRLRDAGVPPLIICRVMRHESWETTRKHYAPGDIQNDAQSLKRVLDALPSDSNEKSNGSAG